MEDNSYRAEYYKILKPWIEGEFVNDDVSRKHRYLQSPKQLADGALEYFVRCEETNTPITYIGLILDIGLKNRSCLDQYKTYNDDFKDLIDVIKLIIENKYIKDLYTRDGFRAAQFILKTNYHYNETTTIITENKDYRININKPEE